jgi:hypothetical protein
MNEQKQGLERPSKKHVAIDAITTNTGLFQFRTDELTNYHVDALRDAIGRGNDLDALDVWEHPTTRKLIVIDGHHRLAAYRKAGHRQKIAVLVHRCALKQARLLALEGNAKTRLPMTTEEKAEAAWSLDREGSYSKAEIVKYTSVSDGTVAAMRRAVRKLMAESQGIPSTWGEAKRKLQGWEATELSEDEREAIRDEKVSKLLERVGPALTFAINHDPEVFAEAIQKVAGHKLKFAVDYWGGWLDDGEPIY